MTDPTIIEAAAQALCDDDNLYPWESSSEHYLGIVRSVLFTAAPMIRAAALEEAAAGAAERFSNSLDPVAIMNIAAAIRSLKEQP